MEDLLAQMVKLLMKQGEISFEQSALFMDGTKIEANASRYSFVWKTAVSKRQTKLGKRIEEELPKLLEASGTGMTAPGVITVQRLKEAQEGSLRQEAGVERDLCQRERPPQIRPAESDRRHRGVAK